MSFVDLADLLEVSRSNVSLKMSELLAEYPDAIVEKVEGSAKKFAFDFSKIADYIEWESAIPELPQWLHRNTYEAIIEALGGVKESEELRFTPSKWVDQFQRGGVLVEGYEVGQKHPEWNCTLRIDNCIVISITERESL